MIFAIRGSVISIGFSTIRCLPALAAATAGSACAPLGVQIETMSTSLLETASSTSAVHSAPQLLASSRPVASVRLLTTATRAPGMWLMASTWTSAMLPAPMMAKLSDMSPPGKGMLE